MRKIFILIFGLSFLAASCDITGGLFGGGGTRGIFKSEDAGQTFNTANVVKPKGDINGLSVTSTAFDPGNADIIYASAGSGIYKSEDAGATWRYILAGIAVSDIVLDPFAGNTVYAAGISGTSGKIIKSNDAGLTWVDIYSEPSKNNTVLSIAISPLNSSTILAGLYNGELIRSTDSGRTWQVTKDFSNRVIQIKFGSSNVAFALTARDGLYKSVDSGVTWTLLTNSLIQDSLSSLNKKITSVSEFFNITIDKVQAGVLYLGTEEGLFRSVDDGANWSLLSLPLRNAALRVSAMAIDPYNSNIIFASVSSTLYKSVNGGVTWETRVLPTKALIDSILINPFSTNIIYLGLRGS